MKKSRINVSQLSTSELSKLLLNSSGTQKSKIQNELTKRNK